MLHLKPFDFFSSLLQAKKDFAVTELVIRLYILTQALWVTAARMRKDEANLLQKPATKLGSLCSSHRCALQIKRISLSMPSLAWVVLDVQSGCVIPAHAGSG